jgi:regulator of sigma D
LVDANEFLDDYNELFGILKKIEVRELGTLNVVLRDLKRQVRSFLEAYDRDKNEEIDIEELTNEREKFGRELGRVQEIVKAIKELEDKVVDYKQGKLARDERKVEEGDDQVLETLSASKVNGEQIKSKFALCSLCQLVKNYWLQEQLQTNIEQPTK